MSERTKLRCILSTIFVFPVFILSLSFTYLHQFGLGLIKISNNTNK